MLPVTYFNPAFLATKSSALKLARSGTQIAEDVWIRNLPLVSDFQREAGEKFSCFRQKYLSINGTDFFDVKNSLPLLTTSACKNIQAFHDQFFPHKGIILFSNIKFTSTQIPSICRVEIVCFPFCTINLPAELVACMFFCLSYLYLTVHFFSALAFSSFIYQVIQNIIFY